MLCPSVYRPPSASIRPFLDLHWPIRSLWPETRPLFFHMEQEMIRHLEEMRQSMEFMERLRQKIFEEIDQVSSSYSTALQPIAFQELRPNSGTFALSLDTKEFTPEELSIKQVGRKLRVSGKTEKKQDDGKGSYSYRCQEFRQDFDLPDGVNPENVTCSLVDGQLQIQAPRQQMVDRKERVIPISLTTTPTLTRCSETEVSSTGTEVSESGPATGQVETS
ncbi:heat shock protein beta-11 [Thalassophryne amazonica]|uniref:heat shock protein beta-11 n=1 Tax=Thalassophryne amazonica TaxID=390379 RepID=UPI001471F80B|nr:heat shock protein beta-11 [Thalassophryne amazonica]